MLNSSAANDELHFIQVQSSSCSFWKLIHVRWALCLYCVCRLVLDCKIQHRHMHTRQSVPERWLSWTGDDCRLERTHCHSQLHFFCFCHSLLHFSVSEYARKMTDKQLWAFSHFDVNYISNDIVQVHVVWTCACVVPEEAAALSSLWARRPVQCCEQHYDVALISDQQQVRKPFKRWYLSHETAGDPCALLPCAAFPDPAQPAPAVRHWWQNIMY